MTSLGDTTSAPPAGAAVPAWRRWPLPAVAAWAAGWAAFALLRAPVGAPLAALAGLGLSLGLAARQAGWARRLWVAAGFPLSVGLSGTAAWPAAVWLLPPLLLWCLYPPRAWRDAPVYPTPPGALDGLAGRLALAPGARVLDAGCGVGDGLRALHRAWPRARLEGIEWSWPLAIVARWRCAPARVHRGDMWRPGAWRGLDLVYLFQRPESMARAWDKARAEMPGGWLVSLEFGVPGRRPDLRSILPGGREVLAWRVPGAEAGSQPGAGPADNCG